MDIKKLDTFDVRFSIIIGKINELVDKINDLDMHYHEVMDIPEEANKTSYPKLDNQVD